MKDTESKAMRFEQERQDLFIEHTRLENLLVIWEQAHRNPQVARRERFEWG